MIPAPRAVIAHRGASLHAPEATRPAFLLARDLGADYLEMDLQRTQDGHLIALHDTNLRRTTNISDVFPERADDPVNRFTLAEIQSLDAGSWFNAAYPDYARPGYVGLRIQTLDEVRQIAENGDNQPGLYPETKAPELFPGIEGELASYLAAHRWIGPQARTAPASFDRDSRVGVGYTSGRVVLQTFSRDSLAKLAAEMPDTPKILLLYLGGDDRIPANPTDRREAGEPEALFRARQRVRAPSDYDEFLDFACAHGAIGVGPSATRADLDATWSYGDLAAPWMIEHAHARGLCVHVYTLDHEEDFRRYFARGVDGIFTNDTAALLRHQNRAPRERIDAVLKRHGY